MTAEPDTRVPPIPAGTLCQLGAEPVRVYARIHPGTLWDGRYLCVPVGQRSGTYATREQLVTVTDGPDHRAVRP